MKRSLLYIGILFSAVSCGRNDHALQSGDLLFQAGESSDMTGAITAATGENGRLNFSHVGIAVVKNGADSVLEATTNGGVRLTALPEFLARSAKIGGRPAVVAMRLKDTAGVCEAVRRAQNYLGLPYDYSFRPDNGKFYCSELVWECYRTSDGSPIFTARPMKTARCRNSGPSFSPAGANPSRKAFRAPTPTTCRRRERSAKYTAGSKRSARRSHRDSHAADRHSVLRRHSPLPG